MSRERTLTVYGILLKTTFSFVVMRLGKKKDKERDLEKEQCVEGVARLICSPKQSHPVPLRGKGILH